MNKEEMMKYAPYLAVVLAFFMQYNLFVTPVQLEQTHREVLKEIESRYATKESEANTKAELAYIKTKIDKIYDILDSKGGLR